MRHARSPIALSFVLVFLGVVGLSAMSWAEPVMFKEVHATYQDGDGNSLNKTIDGMEASPEGWRVASRLDQCQAAIFVPSEPIQADLLNLTLFFMSGRPNASFARFAISYTSDASPDFQSRWEHLPVLNCGATTCDLNSGPDDILVASPMPQKSGWIPDNLYWITARMRSKTITGLRIEAYPILREAKDPKSWSMSWSMERDFVLTEFRVEVLSSTTNVALGASVKASHPLFHTHSSYGELKAEALTDGWPSTVAHPNENVADKGFYFEIDLGKIRKLDHIGLRQRGDHFNLNRFGKMRIKLYDNEPSAGAAPTWQAFNRPDGSYPREGEVDLLEASSGTGDFHGRYIRITSENTVPLSPMLAEVEAYETRTARLVAMLCDGVETPCSPLPLRVPPGVQRVAFRLEIPQSGVPSQRLFRWRMRDAEEQWNPSNSLLLEMPCPPAGNNELVIQAAHSDGTWDATQLVLPMVIRQPFTKSRLFFWLMVGATLTIGSFIAWAGSQRRIARLRSQAALAAERTRIARDMHDDVGARLSQLSFMLKALAGDSAMPPSAQEEIQQITEAAGQALGSLDEVVWTVNPKNDRLDSLCRHLAGHATRYLSPLGIACRIESAVAWPQVAVSAQTRHQLAMAFKEALQNVVKHSGADEVSLILRMESDRLIIRVADNGLGLREDAAKSGRSGLANMQSRLAGIGGTCDVRTAATGGTTVEMRVPIT